jgi:hypothetical protein
MVPIHEQTYLKVSLLELKPGVSLNSVIAHSLAEFLTYFHIVQLTGKSQRRSYESAFITLAEEVLLLIRMKNFFHIHLV